MTREQLDLIPDSLLQPATGGATGLIGWLYERGWRMTLLEPHQERQRRKDRR